MRTTLEYEIACLRALWEASERILGRLQKTDRRRVTATKNVRDEAKAMYEEMKAKGAE